MRLLWPSSCPPAGKRGKGRPSPPESRLPLRENTRIPTGSWDEWTGDWVLMTFALNAEEQGRYAASTALRILGGESAGDIPVVRNREAKIILNMGMAKKLGIVFPMDLIESSHLIENWLDELV